jgi:HPt (histidine-containing phosphotransfer) domain-containing protein
MTAHILKGRTGLLGMKELHAAAGVLEQALDSAQPTAELLQALEQGIAAMTAEIHGKLDSGTSARSE